MQPVGTDFWKGSQFLREGEAAALNEAEARETGQIVSTFAETVEASSSSASAAAAASVGEILRDKLRQVCLR